MKGFTLPDHKPRAPESTEAVAILRQLMKDAPDHPGVHHYVIHGFEGSTFAKDAWHSSERYAELVPNIPHALHMPGHIYSQTGRWSDAVKSFDAAAVNERGYMKADSLYGSGHHAHNVHYLATSHSFSGNYDKAIESAKELLAIPENPREKSDPNTIRTAQYQGYFSMMRTMVQFGKWDEILSELPKPERARALAWHHWARAVANANLGDVDGARNESKLFQARLTGDGHPTLRVAERELEAHMAVLRGDWKEARRLFKRASEMERSLRYQEPPNYPRPVAEAWALAARKHGDKVMAARAWKIALEQYPGDVHAESGLKGLGGAGQ
jgi:tetratricopeptide (TPR) repeat protein